MKPMRFFVIFLPLLAFGCRSGSSETERKTAAVTDSVMDAVSPATSSRQCYRQVVGRDTTMLTLTTGDSIVTGELTVLPYQKDQARGPIRGTLANNQITAQWQRTGEGVTQPYEVVFTMKGDSVVWREGERVEKQGVWVLKNPAQSYEYVLAKTDCQ
ncbi:hypothetical protein [Fibrisoma montanum]|nr:hypothetical protein [Fibrisoma montanum]